VTPAVLCEWSRKSDGQMLEIHVPFKGTMTASSGHELTLSQPRYFQLTAEALFEFETRTEVRISNLVSGKDSFVLDPPVLVKIETLRIDRQQVADLITSIQSIEKRHEFSLSEEMEEREIDHFNNTQHQVESFVREHTLQFPVLTQIIEQGQQVEVGNDHSHALVEAMQEDDAPYWQLVAPKDDDVLNKLIYSILQEKHDQQEPIPQVREVMNLCKVKNKYGVLIIANEIKYLDQSGKMQRANAANILKRIEQMTARQLVLGNTPIAA
jgi:hypothetical protein